MYLDGPGGCDALFMPGNQTLTVRESPSLLITCSGTLEN